VTWVDCLAGESLGVLFHWLGFVGNALDCLGHAVEERQLGGILASDHAPTRRNPDIPNKILANRCDLDCRSSLEEVLSRHS